MYIYVCEYVLLVLKFVETHVSFLNTSNLWFPKPLCIYLLLYLCREIHMCSPEKLVNLNISLR